MTAAYLVAFIVGGIAVLSALLLVDVGHGIGHDGLPFLSLTGLSAALLGAGTGGLISSWAGLGGVAAGLVALGAAGALLLAFQGVLLPYLRRQESNSQQGRISYVGLLGTVTLDVPVGNWGEIAFVDSDGNRVRSRAVEAERDSQIQSAKARQAGSVAQAEADTAIAVANQRRDVELARLRAQTEAENAQADQAGPLANARAQKDVGIATEQAEAARSRPAPRWSSAAPSRPRLRCRPT